MDEDVRPKTDNGGAALSQHPTVQLISPRVKSMLLCVETCRKTKATIKISPVNLVQLSEEKSLDPL